MEKHHSNERELLVEITSSQPPDSEHRKNVKEMSPDQQNAKLFELSVRKNPCVSKYVNRSVFVFIGWIAGVQYAQYIPSGKLY